MLREVELFLNLASYAFGRTAKSTVEVLDYAVGITDTKWKRFIITSSRSFRLYSKSTVPHWSASGYRRRSFYTLKVVFTSDVLL